MKNVKFQIPGQEAGWLAIISGGSVSGLDFRDIIYTKIETGFTVGGFEAVEAKQKGDLAISGVDQPGSPIRE